MLARYAISLLSGCEKSSPPTYLTRPHPGDKNSPATSGAARNGEAEPRDLAIDSDLVGRMVPLSYYEIRVAGVLLSEVLLDFDRLTASVEPVKTVVHGPLQDQAALHGLLTRLETFAVQVIEVRRLHDTAVPPDGERRRA